MCACVSVYVPVHVCLRACVRACVRVCACVHACARARVCVCVCVCVCVWGSRGVEVVVVVNNKKDLHTGSCVIFSLYINVVFVLAVVIVYCL